uniref:Putative LOC100900865 [Metaseiulus occidentalis] n=1 Tax=Lepeophtheirus salmonis TaxID=72036 RepID=A0A0K2TYS0_LEPSM
MTIHEINSLHNLQSNGLVEQAVKSIIKKTNKTNIESNLFAWRNTPRADGFSTAQMMISVGQPSYLANEKIDSNDVNVGY